MDVEDIEFTVPAWFCPMASPSKFYGKTRVLYQEECEFLGTTWHSFMRSSGNKAHIEYGIRLAKYYERFDNHMPFELRRHYLRQMVECE